VNEETANTTRFKKSPRGRYVRQLRERQWKQESEQKRLATIAQAGKLADDLDNLERGLGGLREAAKLLRDYRCSLMTLTERLGELPSKEKGADES
jgi:hypothetical protein